MGDGLGEITLDQHCPRSIVEDIDLLSHIAVTPSRIAHPDAAEIKAASRWYGRIVDRPGSDNTIRSHSCSVWLGDTDRKGPYIVGASIDGSTSAQAMLSDLFTPSSNVAGLTLGDYSSLSASAVPITYKHTGFYHPNDDTDANPRWFLDRCSTVFGWQWAVRGTTFDIGETAADIFRTDEVLVAEGLPLLDLSLRIVPGRIDVSRTDADFASRLIAWETVPNGSGGTTNANTAAAPSTFPNDAAGAATSSYTITRWVVVKGFTSNVNTGLTAAPQILADENQADKRFIDITVDAADPAGYIEPGDTVLAWKPEDGVYDLTNEYDTPLGCIYPMSLAVSEMTWPVGPGMGVYLIQNSDSEVIDLSDVFVPERGMTNLVVGEREKTLAEVVNGRN